MKTEAGRGPAAPNSRTLVALESQLQLQLRGRVRDFRMVYRDGGLVLHGTARTVHAKQLALNAVMTAIDSPIRANEIEVGE